MTIVVGVDIGSTASKAVVLTDGEPAARVIGAGGQKPGQSSLSGRAPRPGEVGTQFVDSSSILPLLL